MVLKTLSYLLTPLYNTMIVTIGFMNMSVSLRNYIPLNLIFLFELTEELLTFLFIFLLFDDNYEIPMLFPILLDLPF